jgi:hypothetical protein
MKRSSRKQGQMARFEFSGMVLKVKTTKKKKKAEEEVYNYLMSIPKKQTYKINENNRENH